MNRHFLMNLAWPALTFSLILSGCSPKTTGSDAGSPVSTQWKEGYGGDSIALETVRIIEKTCFTARRLRADLLQSAMELKNAKNASESKIDIADSICNLLNPRALIIESVKQPKVSGIDKDAANYPNVRPRRLEVKAAYWSSLTTTAEARDKLIFHELLPLIGIEDTDYVRSSRLLIAMQAERGKAPDIACDAHRIEAALSGADPDLARFMGRELGMVRCHSAVEVLSSYNPDKPEDNSVRSEMAQSLALGAFVGLVQSAEPETAVQFEDFYIALVTALPAALGNWSPALCSLDRRTKGASSNLCGGLMAFIFGATPEQKNLIVGKNGITVDFDRATMSVLNRMITSPRLMAAFVENGRINQDLAKASIRAQNWMPLMLLGQVHRSLKLPGRASEAITLDFSWSDLLQEGEEVQSSRGDRNRIDLRNCTLPNVRGHAEMLLDGGMSTLHCEEALST